MSDAFLKELDGLIQTKHLLLNPFYQAWSKGEIAKECLKEYALQYYHHVRAFPTYLSALHCHVDDMDTRKEIVRNLCDEEMGSPNHIDLWKEFARSLGVEDEQFSSHQPNQEMMQLIQTFRSACQNKCPSVGLASLYAYESQIPEVSLSKIEGLKAHYGMNDPKTWRYFSVHVDADKEHSQVERALISKHYQENDREEILDAANASLDALNHFLASLPIQ